MNFLAILKAAALTLDGVSEDAQKEYLGQFAGNLVEQLEELDPDVLEIIIALPADWLVYFAEAFREELIVLRDTADDVEV